jgi:hypothetical protein
MTSHLDCQDVSIIWSSHLDGVAFWGGDEWPSTQEPAALLGRAVRFDEPFGSRIFASWNHIRRFLRQLDALKPAA